MRLTHVDLFSGFGMMALGIQRAGFETRLFCEIEPYAQQVLRKHWPETPIESDVRNVRIDTLRRHGIGSVAILTGGFPCQQISAAGRGEGIGTEDAPTDRSGLWYEMLRVIRECRPAWVLIENVPRLRTLGADTVLQGLEEAGYAAECFVVGADDCGAPHRRKRVWIVAVADAARQQTHTAEPGGLHTEPALSRRELAYSQRSERRPPAETGQPDVDGTDGGGAEAAGRSELLGSVVAYDDWIQRTGNLGGTYEEWWQIYGDGELAHANTAGRGERRRKKSGREFLPSFERGGEAMGFAHSLGRRETISTFSPGSELDAGCRSLFPPARNDFRAWAAVAEVDPACMPCVERELYRMADGTPKRLQSHRNARLKGLGNGLIWVIPFLIGSWIRQQIEAAQ